MAFEARKGELVAVIGCGTSHLDRAKLVSNVTCIRDYLRGFLEQE